MEKEKIYFDYLDITDRITPENIQSLEEDEIFVFGSNLAGIHGAGAAKLAFDKKWIMMGEGLGLSGRAYALPTKNMQIKTLPLWKIEHYINMFISAAYDYDNLRFLVTKIGCGLAGYSVKEIAPLFLDAAYLRNICLPKEFWEEMEIVGKNQPMSRRHICYENGHSIIFTANTKFGTDYFCTKCKQIIK